MTGLQDGPGGGPLRMGLVGCGVMGRRHIAGYAALAETGGSNVRLSAVCDLDVTIAEEAADYAQELLGYRPQVFTAATDLAQQGAVEGIDLVTDPVGHHHLAIPFIRAGLPVLCEKPLGLTAAACREITAAAEEHGVVLATAENYRRGPGNRVARAVLKAGLIGPVHHMVHTSLGGDEDVIITPWRHLKDRGAIGFDMAVHYLDIIEYLLGPITTVYGAARIAVPRRKCVDGTFVEATGEDSLTAQLTMESGATVHLAYVAAGGGPPVLTRTLHGSKGWMEVPPDRSGGPVTVHLDGETLSGEGLISALPDFSLRPVEAALFGGVTYDWSFARTDAAHIAAEVHDFAEAVLDGGAPEVDGRQGARSVAATLAILESAQSGAPVLVDDVLSGAVREYQRGVDEGMGLL